MTTPLDAAATATDGDAAPPRNGPAALTRILVALDASDHANRALEEACRLAKSADGTITGIHAYAAMLHDRRFKMMEGGLPERYLDEQEMAHQRDVHDDLISRGLDLISDGYHDAANRVCDRHGVGFDRRSPEGKNYTKIIEEARTGRYDVLALGALGVGAVSGSLIGTVCERVVRRSPIDTFVVRHPELAVGDGPIVVGLDGSALSYGALMTALDIAARTGAEVHAVAAYDPYYHYVAFDKIAGVLSEEAGKVFRFKEQEKLHEELIDDGIAKIYRSHLDVAGTVARDLGAEVTGKLLDGKPFQAVRRYLEEVGASLLVVGKRGVHADDGMDIGGNAENLLRLAPCHVWLTRVAYMPPLDVVAEETVSWSVEAEQRISRAPGFVRDMARRMVVRHAHGIGHTYITSDIVDAVMKTAMPGFADGGPRHRGELAWSRAAEDLIATVGDAAVADNIRLRAIKRARRDRVELPLASNDETVIRTDSMRLGIAALDEDHQIIVSLLNRVTRPPAGDDRLEAAVEELPAFTRYHFRREEPVMEICGYPRFRNHRRRRDGEDPDRLRVFRRKLHVDDIMQGDKDITAYAQGRNQEIEKVPEPLG